MSAAMKRKEPLLTVDGLLNRSPWFGAIGVAAQAEVRRSLYEDVVAQGNSLSHQNEIQHYWIGVLEGMMIWSITMADGRAVAFSAQTSGSWFGEGTLLRGQPRQSELVALRRTRVALMPAETFHWLRRTEPGFSDFLLMQINDRLHWFMSHFAAYGLLNADQLVARALAGLVHPLCSPFGDRLMQITQEELARLAAVSRQRCNESLVRMKREGLVQLRYGAIEIVDLDRLQALAAG